MCGIMFNNYDSQSIILKMSNTYKPRALKNTKLIISEPNFVKFWHPLKNKGIDLKKISYGSNYIAFWLCDNGHIFQRSVKQAYNSYKKWTKRKSNNNEDLYEQGIGCKKCVSLGYVAPELKKQWHAGKNKDLKFKDLSYANGKKVYWRCLKNRLHPPYRQAVSDKFVRKRGCPYCAGKKVTKKESFGYLYPDVAKEWHPTKNGKNTSFDFTIKSKFRVWWQCQIEKTHIWEARIGTRTPPVNASCGKCSNKSSRAEMRIYSELEYIFDKSISHRKQFGNRIEADIVIQPIKLALEYDGSYFHKRIRRIKHDNIKNEYFDKHKINLLRVRQKPLKKIGKNDVITINDQLTKKEINEIFKNIKIYCGSKYKTKINNYLKEVNFKRERNYKKYLSLMPSPLPQNSLLGKQPKLAKEWDYKKNYPLRPENFSPRSHKKVWWICLKNKKHPSWEATIDNRNPEGSESGCPRCSGNFAFRVPGENLKNTFPKIAAEWDIKKNLPLRPEKIRPKSHKNVWWICKKNKKHLAWKREVYMRIRGSGCPTCNPRYKRVANFI